MKNKKPKFRVALKRPGSFLKILLIALLFLFVTFTVSRIDAKVETGQDISIFKEVSGIFQQKKPSFGNPIWFDYDKNGDIDIMIINHFAAPSLLQNNGDFVEKINSSGIGLTGDRHGVAAGDYNNDGYVDLFITRGAAKGSAVGQKADELLENNGSGSFVDVTESMGVENSLGRGRSANWIDFDNDGLLDLYITNYLTNNIFYKNNGNKFIDVTDLTQIGKETGEIQTWVDYDNDGDLDVMFTWSDISLWRNDNGIFTDVTEDVGFNSNRKYSSASWADYDNDGDLDVFLTRGFQDVRNSVHSDSNKISFSDEDDQTLKGISFQTSGRVTLDLFVLGCRNASSVLIGENNTNPNSIPFELDQSAAQGQPNFDLDQDKNRFFIWFEDGTYHISWRGNGAAKYFYGVIESETAIENVQYSGFNNWERNPDMPELYRNDDGQFQDVTSESNLTKRGNFLSSSWADYDNDGDLDLYVVEDGRFYQNMDNTLYGNNGDGTFNDITALAKVKGSLDDNGRGDGASWGDYDGDGDLDLYVTNGHRLPIIGSPQTTECLEYGPHIFYENEGNANNWINLDLIGTISNRDAVGSKVTVTTGEITQFSEVNTGQSYYSQGKQPVHFGVGNAQVIDMISVDWPSGHKTTLHQVPVNQVITLSEEESGNSQVLYLPAGWSTISSNLLPLDTTVVQLLIGVVDKMVIMKNGLGQVYWPVFGVNQITDWKIEDGYQIFMNEPAVLTVVGAQIMPAQTPINLDFGWSLFSYLDVAPMAVGQALLTIEDQLVIVKDWNGQIYWPEYGVNQIGEMNPGQGYQVYMNMPGTLYYPANE